MCAIKWLRNVGIGTLAVCAAMTASATKATAEGPVAVPAVLRTNADDALPAATVQTVAWRGGWGPRVGVYGGAWGPRVYVGPRYYGGYRGYYGRPYYGGYYGGYGGYGGYGYGGYGTYYGAYPVYGYGTYGYGYPAYGVGFY